MNNARTFKFFQDFSQPDASPPQTPMITVVEAEELADAARQEGREAGRSEGYAQGQSRAEETIAHQNLALCRKISDDVEAMRRAEKGLLELLEIQATRLVLSVVKRLTDTLSEKHAETMAQSVVRRVIGQVENHSKLSIRAAPDAVADVERLFANALPSNRNAPMIVVQSDDNLIGGEIQVDWRDGALSYDVAPAAAAVSEILEEALNAVPAQSL